MGGGNTGTILGVVGAVVGGYFGGPMGASVGASVGGAIGGLDDQRYKDKIMNKQYGFEQQAMDLQIKGMESQLAIANMNARAAEMGGRLSRLQQNINETNLQREALQVERSMAEERLRLRRYASGIQGQQVMKAAKSGVLLAGSPEASMEGADTMFNEDLANLELKGHLAIQNINSRSYQDRYNAMVEQMGLAGSAAEWAGRGAGYAAGMAGAQANKEQLAYANKINKWSSRAEGWGSLLNAGLQIYGAYGGSTWAKTGTKSTTQAYTVRKS